MNLKKNKKGFTLAELLIVVAIIAILIAVLVPTFTASLDKAKHAVDIANVRSAYSEAVIEYMTEGTLISHNALSDATLPANGGNGSEVTYDSVTETIKVDYKGRVDDSFKVDPALFGEEIDDGYGDGEKP